jgi:aminopeptidase N
MIDYMKLGPEQSRPIMTNSEQILHFGDNAYGKPATALWVLRHTVMGPELFDAAFKEYSQRWAFKRPMPADFFRTMEDASAVDLDWFWKGWFYTTDHVDVSVDEVKWYRVKNMYECVEKNITASKRNIGEAGASSANSDAPGAEGKEMPATYEEITVLDTEERFYTEFKNRLDDNAIRKKYEDKNLYEVTFSNKGGLVTPLIIEFTYADGSKKVEKIPAEIWRKNENEAKKVFASEKEVVNITLDPYQETADVNTQDNYFPRKEAGTRFEQFKKRAQE